MERMKWVRMTMWALALILAAACAPRAALAEGAPVACYVEKADIQGEPGDPAKDPAAMANYELFETITGAAPDFLRTEGLGRRFAHKISQTEAADGAVSAYYQRGRFTYVFDVFSALGEMTIGGVTHRSGDADPYRVSGKYGQSIPFPGLDNGLMPKNANPDYPDAYCAGWTPDPRTGDRALLTYSPTVSERMLPTDDMPYEGLTFTLTATWFMGADACVLRSFYEQLPEEADAEGCVRMEHGGKTYIAYPAQDYALRLPKGSAPEAGDAPGLSFVARLDPEPGTDTWRFLYDRQRFLLTIESRCETAVPGADAVPFQSSLGAFDPGWTPDTVVGGKRFSGWYIDGERAGDTLAELYMAPHDLVIEARWS